MSKIARKQKKPLPKAKNKERFVHDIIKVMEYNHAKNDLALTEIKMLCACPKTK